MKKAPRPANIALASTVLHRGLAETKRDLMRQGVVLRAQTIPDRRKVANKKACRKGARWD